MCRLEARRGIAGGLRGGLFFRFGFWGGRGRGGLPSGGRLGLGNRRPAWTTRSRRRGHPSLGLRRRRWLRLSSRRGRRLLLLPILTRVRAERPLLRRGLL